jgi:hypothetical protein
MKLTVEMQELVHNGAGPIRMRDRSDYYERVASELRKVSVLTNGIVLAAIQTAQREILRPAAV